MLQADWECRHGVVFSTLEESPHIIKLYGVFQTELPLAVIFISYANNSPK